MLETPAPSCQIHLFHLLATAFTSSARDDRVPLFCVAEQGWKLAAPATRCSTMYLICSGYLCTSTVLWEKTGRQSWENLITAPGTGRLVTCDGHITILGTCSVAYHCLHCCNCCGHKCAWSEDHDSFHLKWVVWPSLTCPTSWAVSRQRKLPRKMFLSAV